MSHKIPNSEKLLLALLIFLNTCNQICTNIHQKQLVYNFFNTFITHMCNTFLITPQFFNFTSRIMEDFLKNYLIYHSRTQIYLQGCSMKMKNIYISLKIMKKMAQQVFYYFAETQHYTNTHVALVKYLLLFDLHEFSFVGHLHSKICTNFKIFICKTQSYALFLMSFQTYA